MRRVAHCSLWTAPNNVLEQFFGTAKQGLRRRVSRANLGLGRDLVDQPPRSP